MILSLFTSLFSFLPPSLPILHTCLPFFTNAHTQNVYLKIKKEGKEKMAEEEGKGEGKRQKGKRKSKKKEKEEERGRGGGREREWETDIRGKEKKYNMRSWEEGNREEYSAKKSKP